MKLEQMSLKPDSELDLSYKVMGDGKIRIHTLEGWIVLDVKKNDVTLYSSESGKIKFLDHYTESFP